MAIQQVALTDTFDVWRTRTNQLIILTDDIDTNTALFFTSNSAPLTLTSDVKRKGNVYFQLSSNSDFNNAQTTTVATSKAVNDVYLVARNSLQNTSVTLAGNLTVNGDISTTKTTFNLANTTASNIYFGGAADWIYMGKPSGAIQTRGSLLVDGDLTVSGGDISTSLATASLFEVNATTLKIGLEATDVQVGSTAGTGNTTINSARIRSSNGSVSAPTLTSRSNTSAGLYWPTAGAVSLAASGQDAVYVGPTGNVGIGTTTTSYKLYVQGDIYATGDITAFSDAAIKTDIIPISGALDTVSALNGVKYTRVDNNQRKIGLIAQEVQKVLPEVVVNADGNIGVSYQTLTALLIEAVKELSEKVKKLESK